MGSGEESREKGFTRKCRKKQGRGYKRQLSREKENSGDTEENKK